VVVHTAYSKRRVIEEGWMEADKVHVIPHGVLDHYSSRDHSPVTESAEKTILFFGAIAPYKGLDVLLKAFASMPSETRAKTRIVVAGRADMNIAPIRQLADQLGIAGQIDWNIRFINDREIPGFFRKATVVALPYREIDQSGVLLTAIAFDKPIVATRVGGIPETIEHGTHGLLVQPDNVQELAHALHSVLVNAEWRCSMQHAVHVLGTGELSWRNVARKTIDLYEQLLQERRSEQRTFPQASKSSRTIR
jgi:glycosyltransferase involved in cell wall biosynthesis